MNSSGNCRENGNNPKLGMHCGAIKIKVVASTLIVLLAAFHNLHVNWRGLCGAVSTQRALLCCPTQRVLQVSMSHPSLRSNTNPVCASTLHQILVSVRRGRWHPAGDMLILLLPLRRTVFLRSFDLTDSFPLLLSSHLWQ